MAAWYELDGHVRDDVPALPQVTGNTGATRGAFDAAIDLEEPLTGFEDALCGSVAALCCKSRLDAEHRRQPGVILAGDAGVRRRHQPADRAAERAGDQHRRGLDSFRRQLARGGPTH